MRRHWVLLITTQLCEISVQKFNYTGNQVFPSVYRTRNFITQPTEVRNWALSWAAPYSLKSHLNIILRSTLTSPTYTLDFTFPDPNFEWHYSTHGKWSTPSHLAWLHNIRRRVQITNLLFTQPNCLLTPVTNSSFDLITSFFSTLFSDNFNTGLRSKNSVALVRKRTMPTERPPFVGEVSANLCG
jgi:hypothetical protein